MKWTPPPVSCATRCRVLIWNSDELCVHGEGLQRRVRGARREDTPSDYDDVERDALSMIDDVVDEQAYVANATGEMLGFLALGDGESWNQAKTSSDCTIWDTLVSRTFARGQIGYTSTKRPVTTQRCSCSAARS
eukprot:5226517-Pyramimonas_sp.AAC.1